jgi:hypothetical protein
MENKILKRLSKKYILLAENNVYRFGQKPYDIGAFLRDYSNNYFDKVPNDKILLEFSSFLREGGLREISWSQDLFVFGPVTVYGKYYFYFNIDDKFKLGIWKINYANKLSLS